MKKKKRYTLEQLGMDNFYDFLEMKEEFYNKKFDKYMLTSSLNENLYMIVCYADRLERERKVCWAYKTHDDQSRIFSLVYILDEKPKSKQKLKVKLECDLTKMLIKENAPEIISIMEKQELEKILLPNKDKTKIRRI